MTGKTTYICIHFASHIVAKGCQVTDVIPVLVVGPFGTVSDLFKYRLAMCVRTWRTKFSPPV